MRQDGGAHDIHLGLSVTVTSEPCDRRGHYRVESLVKSGFDKLLPMHETKADARASLGG